MSTRSAIAYGTPEKWQGVYCHWDGSPRTRGKQIWDVLHEKFIGNKGQAGISNEGDPSKAIKAFTEIYIAGHPGGWSSFPEECYCHSPEFVMRDGKASDMRLSDKKADPLSIEYVYILNPEKKTMTILTAESKPGSTDYNAKILDKTFVDDEGYTNYGHCAYRHVFMAEVDLLGAEPNWETIEPTEE